jgi:hypothetical protein
MNIPEQYYNIILKEFKDVQNLFMKANSPFDKLYYFSACHGIINRVMNLHYDPILIFMHQMLQITQQTLSQRLDAPKTQGVVSNSMPVEMIVAISTYLDELILAFEQKDENAIRKVLEKYSNLSYATTGNGFYMYLRGKLTL